MGWQCGVTNIFKSFLVTEIDLGGKQQLATITNMLNLQTKNTFLQTLCYFESLQISVKIPRGSQGWQWFHNPHRHSRQAQCE